jgi:hypothetical protein
LQYYFLLSPFIFYSARSYFFGAPGIIKDIAYFKCDNEKSLNDEYFRAHAVLLSSKYCCGWVRIDETEFLKLAKAWHSKDLSDLRSGHPKHVNKQTNE